MILHTQYIVHVSQNGMVVSMQQIANKNEILEKNMHITLHILVYNHRKCFFRDSELILHNYFLPDIHLIITVGKCQVEIGAFRNEIIPASDINNTIHII